MRYAHGIDQAATSQLGIADHDFKPTIRPDRGSGPAGQKPGQMTMEAMLQFRTKKGPVVSNRAVEVLGEDA